MTEDLSSIKAQILGLAKSGSTAPDYKTIAEALKALADYEKSSTDASDRKEMLRYESIKSFSTAIVPLLTLMTLAITVYFQWSQAQMTSRANEDAQWRTVVDTMSKNPSPTVNAVAMTGLIPFYDSDRYGDQARETMFLLTRQLTDETAFETLFGTAIKEASWARAKDLVRLGEMLQRGLEDIDQRAAVLQNLLAKGMANPPGSPLEVEIDIVQHQRDQVLKEQAFLGNQVGILLRQPRAEGTSIESDFSGFMFFKADLSKADLSGLNLTSATFHQVDVNGATLTPEMFESSGWYGTKWWTAAKISGPLLSYLIANAAPYMKAGEEYGDGSSIDRATYVAALQTLCTDAGISCDLEHVQFGPGQ